MGRATAHLLAREGAHVAVTDLDQTACDKIVGEIEAAGFTTARAYAMDMSDNAAIAATAKTIIDDLGGTSNDAVAAKQLSSVLQWKNARQQHENRRRVAQ